MSQKANTNNNTTLHIDINSYFATILQQENPYLRGKPIGVVKELGRTCIIAASQEAKQHGVKTASNTVEARHLCPNLILIPASFDRYLDTTQKLHQLFRNICPQVWIYSLDEAFLDLSDCQKWYCPSMQQVAIKIQELIKQKLGEWVTCNIGIGPNRFLAKLLSEVSPKGSINTINIKILDQLLASVSFNEVCGIGSRLQKKLKSWNITNLIQLRFYSESELTILVGPFWARELKKMAWGEETRLLELIDQPPPNPKSIGRSITTRHLITKQSEIETILLNLVEEVTYKARTLDLSGRRIGLTLTGSTQSWSTQQSFIEPIRHTADMFVRIKSALLPDWQQRFPIIKLAITLSRLQPLYDTPIPLWPHWQKQEKLALAIDKVNTEYGLFTLYPARLLKNKKIRPEVTGFFGDKQFWGVNDH